MLFLYDYLALYSLISLQYWVYRSLYIFLWFSYFSDNSVLLLWSTLILAYNYYIFLSFPDNYIPNYFYIYAILFNTLDGGLLAYFSIMLSLLFYAISINILSMSSYLLPWLLNMLIYIIKIITYQILFRIFDFLTLSTTSMPSLIVRNLSCRLFKYVRLFVIFYSGTFSRIIAVCKSSKFMYPLPISISLKTLMISSILNKCLCNS